MTRTAAVTGPPPAPRAAAPANTVYEITRVTRWARPPADDLIANGWAARLVTGRHRRTP